MSKNTENLAVTLGKRDETLDQTNHVQVRGEIQPQSNFSTNNPTSIIESKADHDLNELDKKSILDHPIQCKQTVASQNPIHVMEVIKHVKQEKNTESITVGENMITAEPSPGSSKADMKKKVSDADATCTVEPQDIKGPNENVQTVLDNKHVMNQEIIANVLKTVVMCEATGGASKVNEKIHSNIPDQTESSVGNVEMEKTDSNIPVQTEGSVDDIDGHNNRSSTRAIDKGTQDSLIKKVNKLVISDSPSPLSEVLLKHPSEALKHLLVYENSTDEDDEYDDFEKNWQFYTQSVPDVPETNSNHSYSDDSESDSVEFLEAGDSDNSDDGTSTEAVDLTDDGNRKKPTQSDIPNKNAYLEEKHEPSVDITKLKIDYNKEEFLHIGHVKAIIDTIVTVEAIPETPAYDLDSVLFVENKTTKRPLGAIFDVIGPVTSPIYCIRFKSREEVDGMELKVGVKVFSAPNSEYTQYVFVKELLKFRGTDASWVGDGEIPEELVEFSDGEKEAILEDIRETTRKRKHGSLERHKRFEKSMNKYNTMNSKVYQMVDIHERMDRGLQNICTSTAPPVPQSVHSVHQPFIHHFNPSVPPPVFHVAQPAMLGAPGGSAWRESIAAPSTIQAFPQMMAVPPTSHTIATDPLRFPSPSVMLMVPGQGNSAQYHRNRGSRSKKRGNRGSFVPREWYY